MVALENSHSPIHNTLKTATTFITIQQILQDILPQGSICHVVRFQEGELVVAVGNAAMASKLRQLVPSIAAHLHQQSYPITKLKIKVMASLAQPIEQQNTPTISTKQILQSCHQAYQTLLDTYPDGPLAETLRKILSKTAM